MDKSLTQYSEFEQEIKHAMEVPAADSIFAKNLRVQMLNNHPITPRHSVFGRMGLAVCLTVIALLLISVLAIGPGKVWAAVRSFFGYIPEVGFVQTGSSIRILSETQTQEREGIILSVSQVIADSQRLIITYSADGIAPDLFPKSEDAPFCSDSPYIILANGSRLDMQSGKGNGWPNGFETSLVYAAIPVDINSLRFVVPCIQGTIPGAAPENWDFILVLKIAPPDFQVLPVIEISPTQPVLESTISVSTPQPTQGISLSLDKYVEMDEGYLLQGSIMWPAELSNVGINLYELEIVSADGYRIPAEPQEIDSNVDPNGEHRLEWAVLTAGKNYSGPWTLSLSDVIEAKAVDIETDIDLGTDPQLGEVMELNRTIDVAGQQVILTMVKLDTGRDGATWLDLHFEADPDFVTGISAWDMNNRSKGGISGHGAGSNGSIDTGWSYDYLPVGIVTVTINQISLRHPGPWQITWTPPASTDDTSFTPDIPTQACLTAEIMQQQIQGEPLSLPDGVNGKVLVEGPSPEGYNFPLLSVMNLDGSGIQVVGPGGWGALSPDAGRVVFTLSDGMYVYDLYSEITTRLNWSTETDYHPMWSPDGEWLAYQNGTTGINITQLDGIRMQKVPGTSASTQLVDWMPDGMSILVSTITAAGSQVQQINIQTGEVKSILTIENMKGGFASLSPDGIRVAYNEKVFGQPAYGVFVGNVSDGTKQLVAELGELNVGVAGWSVDSKWLLVAASEYTSYQTLISSHFLVNPDTCEVIHLPVSNGKISDWK